MSLKRYRISYIKDGKPIGFHDAWYWTRKGAIRALPYWRGIRWMSPIKDRPIVIWDTIRGREVSQWK